MVWCQPCWFLTPSLPDAATTGPRHHAFPATDSIRMPYTFNIPVWREEHMSVNHSVYNSPSLDTKR